MEKYLLNVSTIQQGHKIQLIKEVREKWGEERAGVGGKVAFFEDEAGRIVLEPVGRPPDEDE